MTGPVAEVSAGKVLDHLSVCSDEHRVVLMLAYVDGIPIVEIAEMLGRRSPPPTPCGRGRATNYAATSLET